MLNLNEVVNSVAPEMVQIRHAIHRHPELGCEEYETTKLIKRELEKEGVKLFDYGLNTGAIALIEGSGSGPTIALRADIDALPMQEESGVEYISEVDGVMHSCGHDIHTAVVLGAAKVLNRMKDKLNGNVVCIFQPGEETLRGAKLICETGIFDDIDISEMLGIHATPKFNVGTVGIRYGQFMASSAYVRINVKGTGGHGAHPQMSVDPVVISAYIIAALQTLVSRETSPLDTLVVSICKIHAGTAFNIIPDEVVLEGTVRTLTNEMQDKSAAMIERVAKGIAQSMRGDAKVDFVKGTLPLISDDCVVNHLEDSLKQTVGDRNICHISEATTGSEDFSEYSKYTKIGYLRFGANGQSKGSIYPLHSSKVVLDDGAIPVGIKVVAGYALNTLKI